MIAVLLGLGSEAFAVTKNVTLCFQVQTHFTDGGGDFWPSNAGRPARGVHGAVGTEFGTTGFTLDGNGCRIVSVTTNQSSYTVTLSSIATVSGIEIQSFTEIYLGGGVSTDQLEVRVFSVPIAADIYNNSVAPHQTWNNLAVASYAMSRNTFGLGTHSSRGCCHPNGSNQLHDDGRCKNGNPNVYGPWPGDDPLELQLYNDTTDGNCCASQWTPASGGGMRPAIQVNKRWKFVIAHELGHTLMMERMGKREVNNQNAPLAQTTMFPYILPETNNGYIQCMAGWDPSLLNAPYAPSVPVDKDVDEPMTSPAKVTYPHGRDDFHGADLKDIFSLEYSSTPAREGWASFFSAWLWNRRDQSDCYYDTHVVHDIDLDGHIDNNYGQTFVPTPEFQPTSYNEAWPSMDGSLDCEGGGAGGGSGNPLFPISGDVTARDWLGDMVDSGRCIAPYGAMANRGTEYDWMRFWWDMTTDEGILPDDLADAYVDMCPTNWATADSGATDSLVRRRLEISAGHHGLTGAWNAQKSNGVHR